MVPSSAILPEKPNALGYEGIVYGEQIAKKGVLSLFAVAALKALVGFFTGTVVLYADALTSLSDAITLFASYLGLKLSKKGAEGGFTYGYYRVETFGALLISIFILYLGFRLLISSIELYVTHPETQFHYFAILFVILTIPFSMYWARQLKEAAKKSNSLSLEHNAREKETDIVRSLIVLGGLVASYFELNYVEATIGVGFALLILKMGVETTKSALFYLLDYWDDPSLIQNIEKTIVQYSKTLRQVKKIRLRRAGTWIFGEAFLEISPFSDLRDIRSDLNRLQKKVQELNEHIKDFIIYLKIPVPESVRVAVPVVSEEGLKAQIAKTPEQTKFYAIFDIREGKIVKVEHEAIDLTQPTAVTRVVEILMKKKVDVIINNNMSSLLYYSLQHLHQIQIYPAFPNLLTPEETLKLLVIDR